MRLFNVFKKILRKSKPKQRGEEEKPHQRKYTAWYVDEECICKFCKDKEYLVPINSPDYDKAWLEHNIFMAAKYGE